MRRHAIVALAGVVLTAAPAAAETYRFRSPDGTVHFTNAPTDPRYRRMGFTSGSEAGWLRIPQANIVDGAYWAEIATASERYGVPERLVTAVIRAESGFNPRAVSHKGARGLMQLMPATASTLGVRNSFDPQQNIDGGVRHLRAMIDRFANNLALAVAAYNAGEGAVVRYGGIPPYPETRDYVTKVLGYYGGAHKDTDHSTRVYQTVSSDGSVVYTNIPPRGRR